MQYDTQKVALLAEMLFQWSDADGDDVLQDDEINKMIGSIRGEEPPEAERNVHHVHPWVRLGEEPHSRDRPEQYKRLLRAIVHRADKRRKLQDGTDELRREEWERLIGETVFAG